MIEAGQFHSMSSLYGYADWELLRWINMSSKATITLICFRRAARPAKDAARGQAGAGGRGAQGSSGTEEQVDFGVSTFQPL